MISRVTNLAAHTVSGNVRSENSIWKRTSLLVGLGEEASILGVIVLVTYLEPGKMRALLEFVVTDFCPAEQWGTRN